MSSAVGEPVPPRMITAIPRSPMWEHQPLPRPLPLHCPTNDVVVGKWTIGYISTTIVYVRQQQQQHMNCKTIAVAETLNQSAGARRHVSWGPRRQKRLASHTNERAISLYGLEVALRPMSRCFHALVCRRRRKSLRYKDDQHGSW